MWRPEVGEITKKVVVRSYTVSCHVSVREEREEPINRVIRERTATQGIRGRTRRIEGKQFWQQALYDLR